MDIVRARGVGEAAVPRGSVVVIDVLRAFTTAAYAFAAGAREIVLTSTVEEAFALRARMPGAILIGEVGGKPIPGFDHGNSPAVVRTLDLGGATVILRSSSGTQGVVHAANAMDAAGVSSSANAIDAPPTISTPRELSTTDATPTTSAPTIWLGSLVVARATAHALEGSPRPITLLAMGSPYGDGCDDDGAEDDACADLLEDLLRGRTVNHPAVVQRVLASTAARQALDPALDWITPADLECALEIDRFDFAMSVRRESGLLVARPHTNARG